MLHDHPTFADLQGFLQGDTWMEARERNLRVVRHLLSGCLSCQQNLKAIGWNPERLRRLVQFPPPNPADAPASKSPYDYDRAFAKAERTLAAFFENGRPVEEPPKAILAELFPLLEGEHTSGEINENRAAIPQLVRWLTERSHSVRYGNPHEMLHWAHLARLAVDACSAEIAGGERKLADLKGQAWRQFANALRVCDRLREADEAMRVAQEYHEAGTGDPVLRAQLLSQLASLRKFQRRFEDAFQALENAEEIYYDFGQNKLWAGILVQEAQVLIELGDPSTALDLTNRAIHFFDPEDDSYLLLAAKHNIVRCCVDLGQPEEALSILFEVQEMTKQFKNWFTSLRIRWQEGQLLRELGDLRAAEATLLEVRRGYMEWGVAYEVALVSLDLADVYLSLGRADYVKQVVAEVLPIFRALRIDREALASLLQLRKAAELELRASR